VGANADGLNPEATNVCPMRRDWRSVLVVCVLLAASLATGPAGAVHDASRQFVVDLEADGSATVTATRSYNLSVPAERERFERLANNSTALAERRDAFTQRLRDAAANGSERTARDMRIENVSATTRQANGTGVVELRARWVSLAGVYGAQVVVNEPFSTSFDPNGTLVVRGPDGYVREQVSPQPDRARRNSTLWGEGKDLDGFSARFVDPEATTTGGDGDDGESTPPPEPSGVGRLVGAAGFALIPALLVLFGAKRRDLLADADSGTDADGDGSGGGDDGASGGSDTGVDGAADAAVDDAGADGNGSAVDDDGSAAGDG